MVRASPGMGGCRGHVRCVPCSAGRCETATVELEAVMNEELKPEASHIVLVVGVDLSEGSEHLLPKPRDLVRPVDMADPHLVHVVRAAPFRPRIAQPLLSPDL